MIADKYLNQAKEIVRKHFPVNKAFIFGSSLRDEDFHDVDIAICGEVNVDDYLTLKENFEESDFPRPVDIVLIDKAEKSFQDYVLNKEIKTWI